MPEWHSYPYFTTSSSQLLWIKVLMGWMIYCQTDTSATASVIAISLTKFLVEGKPASTLSSTTLVYPSSDHEVTILPSKSITKWEFEKAQFQSGEQFGGNIHHPSLCSTDLQEAAVEKNSIWSPKTCYYKIWRW